LAARIGLKEVVPVDADLKALLLQISAKIDRIETRIDDLESRFTSEMGAVKQRLDLVIDSVNQLTDRSEYFLAKEFQSVAW
jgi:predicted component of type VI protein secretion system